MNMTNETDMVGVLRIGGPTRSIKPNQGSAWLRSTTSYGRRARSDAPYLSLGPELIPMANRVIKVNQG